MLESKSPTIFLLKVLLITNMILIPLTFVIAPIFIAHVDAHGQWVYERVGDEGKKAIDDQREQYGLLFYVIPVLGTNMVVMATLLFAGTQVKNEV